MSNKTTDKQEVWRKRGEQLHSRQIKQSFTAKQCAERAKSIERGVALFLFHGCLIGRYFS